MSTDLLDPFEQRLAADLADRADQPARSANTDEVWAGARRHNSRRKALRTFTASLAALTMLGTGIGIYAARDARPTVANDAYDPNFRLLPGWLPDGTVVKRLHSPGVQVTPSPSQQRTRGWAKGDRSLLMYESTGNIHPGQATSRDTAIKLAENSPPGRTVVSWTDDNSSYSVSANEQVDRTAVIELVRSLSAVDGLLLIPELPLGLPMQFDVRDFVASGESMANDWSWNAESSRFAIHLDASPDSDDRFNNFFDPDRPWAEGVAVTVRGKPARLFADTNSRSYQWQENGWNFFLGSFAVIPDNRPSVDTLLKVADGLRIGTTNDYLQIPLWGQGPFVTLETNKTTRPEQVWLAPEENVHRGAKVADLIMAEGCVKVVITGADNPEVCIPIAAGDGPIRWIERRTIDGKKVIVLVTRVEPDAVRLSTATDPAPAAGTMDQRGLVKLDFTAAEHPQVDDKPSELPDEWMGIAILPDNGEDSLDLYSIPQQPDPVEDDTQILNLDDRVVEEDTPVIPMLRIPLPK
jgi:hypothetical protein